MGSTEEMQQQHDDMETENEGNDGNKSFDGYENENEEEDDSDGNDDDGESSGNEKRVPLKKRRKLNRPRMFRMSRAFYKSSDEDDDANNSDYNNDYDSVLRNESRDKAGPAVMEKSLSPSPVQSEDEEYNFVDPKIKREGGRLIKYTLRQKHILTEGTYIDINSIPTETLLWSILEKLRKEGKEGYKK